MSDNSSSNSSIITSVTDCYSSKRNISIFTSYFIITIVFLLPILIFVLYVSYKQWRDRRSVATPAMTRHTDIFTLHTVVLELIGFIGSFSHCYGGFTTLQYTRITAMTVGMAFYVMVSNGQSMFQLLTCVERYLAVVHPVTYMGLRQSGGVRIRNISIACVWLLCFGLLGPSVTSTDFYLVYSSLLLVVSSVVVSFCSLSTLCVLIRPGPGEVNRNRESVDPSKQRAFYTILAILGVLLLRFLNSLVSNVMISSSLLGGGELCVLWSSGLWFSLPSSLVLPLLFLKRAGKLPGCKQDTESG